MFYTHKSIQSNLFLIKIKFESQVYLDKYWDKIFNKYLK